MITHVQSLSDSLKTKCLQQLIASEGIKHTAKHSAKALIKCVWWDVKPYSISLLQYSPMCNTVTMAHTGVLHVAMKFVVDDDYDYPASIDVLTNSDQQATTCST